MIERQDLDLKYLGTCFDRQVRIDLWSQDKLKEQTVLLLGVGGLGSVVMMNILRLGVKKLIIVDYDVVDTHNLNRQIMFGPADVGQPKVEAAIKNSSHHNIGETEIISFHGNALTNWQKIVEFAKEAQVVFNCIDHGDKFDAAVASLCMKVKIPLIMGGTFATMFTIDYLNPEGIPCFLCSNDETRREVQLMEKIKPELILDLADISFLPKNNNPIGRSSVLVCTICGEFMVSHFTNYLFLSEERNYKTQRMIGYHNTFEIINFDVESEKKCPFCGDPNYVQPQKVQIQKFQASENKQQQTKAEEQNVNNEISSKIESTEGKIEQNTQKVNRIQEQTSQTTAKTQNSPQNTTSQAITETQKPKEELPSKVAQEQNNL